MIVNDSRDSLVVTTTEPFTFKAAVRAAVVLRPLVIVVSTVKSERESFPSTVTPVALDPVRVSVEFRERTILVPAHCNTRYIFLATIATVAN